MRNRDWTGMRLEREDLRLEGALFFLAVQFLTRLPVPGGLPWSDDLQVRAVKYYPLVGALVGLIGAGVLWLTVLWFPPVVAVLLSLAAMLIVTGGMHEDGLADAADGLVGGQTREAALAIMRDSRIGSYGALALGTVLALKVAALAAMPPLLAGLALVFGQGLGRMAVVHVIATTRYARRTGGKFPTPSVTPDGYRWALASAFALLALMVITAGIGAALVGMLGCIAFAQVLRFWIISRIGGYTGDCLGAVALLGELGLLLGVLAWL